MANLLAIQKNKKRLCCVLAGCLFPCIMVGLLMVEGVKIIDWINDGLMQHKKKKNMNKDGKITHTKR